jgi:peptide/nickel transport system permease protein
MLNYLGRRLLFMIPLLLGITVITFVIIHLSPGRPTDVVTYGNPKLGTDTRARLEALYGLDKPLPVQYYNWLTRLAKFDFGSSFTDDRPVIKKIAERLPATIILNFFALLVIFLVAIPLGVLSAAKKDSTFDQTVTVTSFIAYAMPTFWLALLLMMLFGVYLRILPLGGMYSANYEYLTPWGKALDLGWHLILPVFVSAFTGFASITRYSRSQMLEVLHQDFVRTARAKGLPESKVIYKHALRNALLPIITLLGLSLPALIGGGVIFETIFSWPGMGRLGWEAVMSRDYPVIMGVGVLSAIFTLVGNLLADIMYAYADPRIRYK